MEVRRIWRGTWLAGRVWASLCLVLACMAGTAAAEPPPGEAGWMYDAGTVVAIDLTLSPAEKAKLEVEPGEYVKGTFSLSKTGGGPGGTETPVVASLPVEVRLKGNVAGSFRTLDGKAAFKLKFKKSEPFLGLRKMTLNNMVEDPSFIHETLAYRLFRASGTPASRTGFAWLRLNGEDFGLYLNLENLDKVDLERWFGPFADPQHLYEGESGVDVEPGRAGEFEVDEGDEANRSDLEALIESANTFAGPGWGESVSSRIDLEEMTRMWAVEKYVGHWDGYSGEETPFRPNNYYLYGDAEGRFQMLPWGTDNTWEPLKRPEFEGDAGLLFDDCEADPECENLYRKALRGVQGVVDGLDLDALAAETADRLEPWQLLEQASSRHEHDMPAITNGVEETREFIADRPAELSAFLGPEEDDEGESRHLSPLASGHISAWAGAAFHVGKSRLAGGALVTHLWLAGSGFLRQTVDLKTAEGSLRACATHATVAGPGRETLECHLLDAVLRRLHQHSLTLKVRTRFFPRSGSPETTFHRVHLDRIRVS